MVGGLISLIWCIGALALSIAKIIPNISMYPEIDFASKVTGYQAPEIRERNSVSSGAITNVLSRLSNANSREIRKGLAGSKFYVRVTETDVEGEKEGIRPVTLVSDNGGSRLSHRDEAEDHWAGSRQEGYYQRYSQTSYHE